MCRVHMCACVFALMEACQWSFVKNFILNYVSLAFLVLKYPSVSSVYEAIVTMYDEFGKSLLGRINNWRLNVSS